MGEFKAERRALGRKWLAAAMAVLGLAGTGAVQAETVVSVTQVSYDAVGRPECTAVRMNPDTYGSLPTGANAACGLGTQGAYGPDRITKTVYDAAGQVVQVRQAVGTPTERVYSTFAYSPNGKVTDSIDANGNRTKLTYDGFDRLSALNYPSTTRPSGWNPSTQANALATAGVASTADYETYQYDANGNRTYWRRRDGNVVRNTYDNLNRSITEWHDGGTLIRPIYTTYDLTGKVTKKRFDGFDGLGVTYAYDGLGRLQWSADMNGRTLSYGYNQASARNGMVFPDNKNQYYAYDALNRLTYTDISGSGVATNWAYNNRGLLEGRGRWNNTSSAFYYDGIGRLTGMHHAFPDSTRNVQWGFTYNPASQITNLTAGNTAQYDYRETQTATDNRTYDGLNRDTGIAALTNGYDARGNMTNDGSRQMTYDLYNRMLTLTGNGQNLQMTYDPEGRLASYTVNGATTTFLYDGVKLIAEYNGAGQMQKRYLHGIGTDDPWAEVNGADVTSSNTSYLYANYQGSIFALANGSGAVTDVYKYGPYGEPKNALNQTSFAGSRFRYTGQTVLPEAQLYYYKARVYDPIQGRFLQTDPIGSKDDLNLYAYVGGDPINGTDPTGLGVLKPFKEIAERIALRTARQELENVGRAGVRQAWREEQRLVRETGAGTRNWTDSQISELLKTGRVKGFDGHHINDKANYPSMAGNPNNIEFLTKAEHEAKHAMTGGYRGTTSGELLDRSAGGRFVSRIIDNKAIMGIAAGAFYGLQALDKLDPWSALLDPDYGNWKTLEDVQNESQRKCHPSVRTC
ncbi:RHS repeat-associated core domain-containing protein [Asticcacaulis sp. DW145]|uniref:RHS repeat-associated core domain-containing protein n=1 Tax=Asticcacaulis sp. DW145 TaxID=3095608 RepID=UPI00308E6A6D|nr:RHS repeat-associated core domain-containing protein [Asticcacaulis sp. DW145]